MSGILVALMLLAALVGAVLLFAWWDRRHPPKRDDVIAALEPAHENLKAAWEAFKRDTGRR